LAVRRLRAALKLAADPVRARVLISLAWVEAERGRVGSGFRLLDEASALVPPEGRAVLHAQRALLLHRNGRADLAGPEFDLAIAGLTVPLDLVKALNNRALLRLDSGVVSGARDDLSRALGLARRHSLTMMAAVAQANLGCLEYVAGDLPAALGTFVAVRPAYEAVVPGRLAALDVERARALIAAGLFREADRCLAGALAQAAAQSLDHVRAEAFQVRAEAALLAGSSSAAEWSATAQSHFRRRGNPRQAALAALLSLRAAAQVILASGGGDRFGAEGRPGASVSPVASVSPGVSGLAGVAAEAAVALHPDMTARSTPTPFGVGAIEPSGSDNFSPSSTVGAVQPGVSTQAVVPVDYAGPTQPGEEARLGRSAQAAGRAGYGGAVQLAEGMRLGRNAEPASPAQPAEEALLAGKAQPARPAEHAGPAQPGGEGRPAGKAHPAGPAEHAGPVHPPRQPAAELIARGRRLAKELEKLELPEDARVAALVTARLMLTRTTRVATAERLIERYGRPGRHDRLDTRLLWRLTHAELARARGDRSRAERELAEGMATLHRQRARFGCLDLQTGASAHGRDLAKAGLKAAIESGRFGAIFRWSERARAQALLLPPVRPPADPRGAEALEDLRQTRQAIRTAELKGVKPSPKLRARAEELSRTIREAAWSVPGNAPAGARVATPAAVRAVLGDAVLVAYLDTGERLAALVLGKTEAAVVGLGERRKAEEAVLRLRADLDTAAGRAMPPRMATAVKQATEDDARTLAGTLIGPLREHIGDRDLVVVPTGLLATVPWAVLTDRPVTVAPSATAWMEKRGKSASGTRTVLVAGPGNQRGPSEVLEIAGRRPGATVLTGSDATPAATLAAIDGAGVAHLATHGRHEAENALFSSLELAGGPILGYDLQRLAEPPQLVVLAGCELGLSEVRPGDESFGMASALLAAGTTTVIASVCRVADDAASEAMIGLHRELVAGRGPAEALARSGAGTPFICLGS
jgi:hypothetical protein